MRQALQRILDPMAREALDRFVQLVRDTYRDRICRIVLYGSYARGNADPESDLDVLVVLKDMASFWEEADRIGDLAYEATYGAGTAVLLSALPVAEESYQEEMSPLLINVRREGLIVG